MTIQSIISQKEALSQVLEWIKTLEFANWGNDQVSRTFDEEDEQAWWLELRRTAPFDSHWNRASSVVEVQEKSLPLGRQETEILAQIRDAALLKARREVALLDELAESTAKDFELLARAARAGVVDFWLLKLRAKYQAGRFPRGAL